ncbi:protein of unknown function [Vibrio tapetis subsp. tapetis]|uniref:Uncharacterized protein n=1 Tax=Vibrio tapetis subsp. tapetis TaxID=1671868 RepID=A0A2N8ZJZ5_9VIBR|nr:protein of unknown function [Vibrio tapetis subsp. tapetis]
MHQRNLQDSSDYIRFETREIAAQNEPPLIKIENLNSWLTNEAVEFLLARLNSDPAAISSRYELERTNSL